MNLNVSDTGDAFFLKRSAGVVLLYRGAQRPDADCTVTCTKLQLLGMMFGRAEAIRSLSVTGDATAVRRLLQYMTPFAQTFNVIEP